MIASGLLLAGVAATLVLSQGSAEASKASAARFQPLPPEIRWRPDMAAAREYARGRQGDIRFAVVDLRGKLRAFHGGSTAPSASVIKAMFLAAYLRRNSVEDRRLQGWEKAMLGPMIRSSDNGAATRVRNLVGWAAIDRLARKAGMRQFVQFAAWGSSRISARDQARYFYRLERYIPRRHERYARRLLAQIVPSQRWGVTQARPTGWELRLKGGWGIGANVNHQVAFLERHRCRVSVAILTELSPSHGYGQETLRGVAKRLVRGLQRKSVRRACARP